MNWLLYDGPTWLFGGVLGLGRCRYWNRLLLRKTSRLWCHSFQTYRGDSLRRFVNTILWVTCWMHHFKVGLNFRMSITAGLYVRMYMYTLKHTWLEFFSSTNETDFFLNVLCYFETISSRSWFKQFQDTILFGFCSIWKLITTRWWRYSMRLPTLMCHVWWMNWPC